MINCLICDQATEKLTDLFDIWWIKGRKSKHICCECFHKLAWIDVKGACIHCQKTVDNKQRCCLDCLIWFNVHKIRLIHHAPLVYNELAKDIIWKIKHNRDIEISIILSHLLDWYISRRFDLQKTKFIPYPSDQSSQEVRKFSLALTMLEQSNHKLIIIQPFKTISGKNKKQHSKQKQERMDYAQTNLHCDLEIIAQLKKTNCKIVIFDDVLTTGASVVSAQRTLSALGIKNIESLSIFR
ncbi:MAG: ComF family protein [Culicoidibacterales bacterium]